ncbi:MAG: fumarylacetoacetate hydrolase family protein [Rhodospirillales bacterium]
MSQILPNDASAATLATRVWRPEVQGPALCVVRDGALFDVTATAAPTMRDLLELDDPAAYLAGLGKDGERLGSVEEIAAASLAAAGDPGRLHLLAPNDLQAVKACGVTFAKSMLERVIEERAAGDPSKAAEIRAHCTAIVGESLRDLKAGSAAAAKVKEALIEADLWSQYLEVGIGPDAEVFTKCQPMASVGWGAQVGLHPISKWNNPEPEVVLAVDSRGEVKGAALGNDVNLRDVEGRSALLLGKAKDNNASCAIGPFIRVFDQGFSIDDVRRADLDLTVTGEEGFALRGKSSMKEISRDPLDLVAQTRGRHHQYPDGFMLFMGTLFAPTEDRDQPGEGFTHKIGDAVTIANRQLGALHNRVAYSTDCPEWTFGTAALMRNLVARGLL